MFTLFLWKIGGFNPASFQGVCKNDIPIVKDLVRVNIHLYDLDFDDGTRIRELARRSVGKHSNTVRLLRYNSHICYVFDINVLSKTQYCPSCGTWYFFEQSTKFGMISNHVQWKSQRCVPEYCVFSPWNNVWQTWLVWCPLYDIQILFLKTWPFLTLNQPVW